VQTSVQYIGLQQRRLKPTV